METEAKSAHSLPPPLGPLLYSCFFLSPGSFQKTQVVSLYLATMPGNSQHSKRQVHQTLLGSGVIWKAGPLCAVLSRLGLCLHLDTSVFSTFRTSVFVKLMALWQSAGVEGMLSVLSKGGGMAGLHPQTRTKQPLIEYSVSPVEIVLRISCGS